MISEVILILLIPNFLSGQIVLCFIPLETHYYVQEKKVDWNTFRRLSEKEKEREMHYSLDKAVENIFFMKLLF